MASYSVSFVLESHIASAIDSLWDNFSIVKVSDYQENEIPMGKTDKPYFCWYIVTGYYGFLRKRKSGQAYILC